MEKLQERINKNSQNSSKPSSSVALQKRSYPKPELSGEKTGGRKGHNGHGRKLKDPEGVSKIVKSLPTECQECGALLLREDPQPESHQVSELLKIVLEIVEYQRHTLACLLYWISNRAEWPKKMPKGSTVFRLFQGRDGSLFVERILTAVIILHQQKRDVLDYLATAGKSLTLGIPAPSLLPAGERSFSPHFLPISY